VADFSARIDELAEMVGHGDLTGTVSVDQAYSQFQHEGLDLVHPRGGQALFLQQPLMEHHDRYLKAIADGLLTDGGRDAMIRAVEDLAEDGGVATHAPVELGDLRASGHPSVTSDGDTIYDRPPRQHRLSPEELRAKDKARDALEKLTGGNYRGEIGGSGLNIIR
jgi:hypothetical protein